MAILKRRRVLLAKAETTVGTAETLTVAEGSFNAYDVMIQPEIEFEDRTTQGSFGHLSAVPGGYKGKATFKTDCGWDGTATEPSWELFLTACGWVKSGQVFTPRSESPGSNVKTLTIGCNLGVDGSSNGPFKSLKGCAGTFKLVCPTGRMAYIEWEFSGVWITPTDVAEVSPTYPTALPLRYANSTTTFDGVALCLENITLDAGNEVIMRECAAGNGYESAMVVNRLIKVTGNPESKKIATQDRHLQLVSMSEAALTWGLDGPTNAVMTIAAPKAQIIKITEGDRNGIVIDEIEWQCNQNASTIDTDASITFTAAV